MQCAFVAPTLVVSPSCARQCTITAATRPQFKSTKKHTHRRPKKSNLSDRKHGPAVYPPLPTPPPEYIVLSAKDDESS
ncbi:PSRP6 [Auxenochlorella protothecoides x Auxenochlorella symbiontica]